MAFENLERSRATPWLLPFLVGAGCGAMLVGAAWLISVAV